MRVLVTGAGGLLAAAIIREFEAAGADGRRRSTGPRST